MSEDAEEKSLVAEPVAVGEWQNGDSYWGREWSDSETIPVRMILSGLDKPDSQTPEGSLPKSPSSLITFGQSLFTIRSQRKRERLKGTMCHCPPHLFLSLHHVVVFAK